MAGTASIPTRELDLKGTAALLNGPNEVAFELPFVVNGPWDSPLPLPDPASLIQRSGAAAPLLDAVRDRKTRDAVRSALDRLLGPKPAAQAAPTAAAAPAGQ
jgi:AsmA protein